ncbi:MAG: hypothetical protein IKI30_02670 [Oxalobacter sp.]|nr:hypothetical protein [Oxalobacter sp.]
MNITTETITRAFCALMDLGTEKAVATAVADGIEEQTARALVAGFEYGLDDRLKPYNLASQVRETLEAYASADENEIQRLMVADGYPEDVARAFAYGCTSNSKEPPSPEQAEKLENLKSMFDPQECQEICLEALKSMKLLRSAKELIAEVRTSIIDSGASTEAADAFIHGFMIR